MSSQKFYMMLVTALFLGCTHCCSAQADSGQQLAVSASKAVGDNGDQLDQAAIMQMCNESFRTSMGLY